MLILRASRERAFSVFNPQIHSTTLFFTELDRLREKLARVQKSSGGPMGSGVQDQDVGEAMITALETESKYDMDTVLSPPCSVHGHEHDEPADAAARAQAQQTTRDVQA